MANPSLYCWGPYVALTRARYSVGTRGLSSPDEPDLWEKNLQGDIVHWIEIGQPEPARIKSALKRADRVSVYAFGKSSNTWWQKHAAECKSLKQHQVWQFEWPDIEALAQLMERKVAITITITEGLMYINIGDSAITTAPKQLL